MKSIFDKVGNILQATSSAGERILDPTLIATFVSGLITLIRGCSSQSTASARIKEGGPVAMASALRLVKEHTDFKGRLRREKAAELVEAGKNMTDDEMKEVLSNANDLPTDSPPVGIWPVLLFFAFLFCSSTSFAQDPKGIWPIDAEQNARLDRLEAAVDKAQASFETLNSKLDALSNKGQVAPAKVQQRDLTALLKSAPSYQIINGQFVNTSDEHLIKDHGYSPEELIGLSTAQKNALHGAAHSAQSARASVPQYQVVCNGRSCRRVRLHR